MIWDDNYINQRIMDLRRQRDEVDAIAEKYGLSSHSTVSQLSLITVSAHHQSAAPIASKSRLDSISPT
jgi:hypothetical protein